MELKYTILRNIATRASVIEGIGRGAVVGASNTNAEPSVDLVVEEAELNPNERDDLTRDPQVAGAALTMPMQLIEPVESADSNDESDVEAMAGSNAWGIEAVGAHDSNFSGKGVTVAVLDTGIDLSHPAFSGVSIERKISPQRLMMILMVMVPTVQVQSLVKM